MVNIMPFKGYRFNSEKIKDIGNVVAPPYDTISETEQQALYTRNEYNIVRLNKGMKRDDDNELENCFTRASEYLEAWINQGILKQEIKPSFYLYEQEVTYKNTTYRNLGVVGLLELRDLNYDNIFQCEKPNLKSEPVRAALLKKTKANFSMINCIYMEYEKRLINLLNDISEKNMPDYDFKTHETIIGEDVHQRLWVIDDSETISFIKNTLEKNTFYIADGQTRYETALEYKKACEKNNPNHTGKEPYNYIMALFTNAFDDGLIQLPVHRLVKLSAAFSEDFFVSCAQDYFKVEKIIIDTDVDEFLDTMKKQIATTRRENKFGIYCGGKYFYRMTLKDSKHLEELVPDVSDAFRHLDSTILNSLILKELLNIDSSEMNEHISYTTRTSIGMKAVLEGEYSCMIVVNPVRAEHICGVARAHERMPERSIFIFPKASTGVVIYKMEN